MSEVKYHNIGSVNWKEFGERNSGPRKLFGGEMFKYNFMRSL